MRSHVRDFLLGRSPSGRAFRLRHMPSAYSAAIPNAATLTLRGIGRIVDIGLTFFFGLRATSLLGSATAIEPFLWSNDHRPRRELPELLVSQPYFVYTLGELPEGVNSLYAAILAVALRSHQ